MQFKTDPSLEFEWTDSIHFLNTNNSQPSWKKTWMVVWGRRNKLTLHFSAVGDEQSATIPQAPSAVVWVIGVHDSAIICHLVQDPRHKFGHIHWVGPRAHDKVVFQELFVLGSWALIFDQAAREWDQLNFHKLYINHSLVFPSTENNK